MKNINRGFSLAEILVSMVILSIVVLFITSVITTSVKTHSLAKKGDATTFLARKKLISLQDPGALVTSGSDTVKYDNVSYVRNWTVSNTNPALITVTVYSKNVDNRNQAQVAGYVDSINVCPSISPNTAPSSIKVYQSDGSELYTGYTISIPLGTISDQFIARLKGVDADSSLGDVLQLSLSGGTNDDLFKISGDTLYSNSTFDVAAAVYSIKVRARDSDDNIIYRTIDLATSSVVGKPMVQTPQAFSIAENSATNDSVGEVATQESDNTGITWTGTSSAFNISTTGLITVGSAASLNFESGSNSYSFTATASRAGLDTTITINISVADVNEAPTDITLSSTTVPEDAAAHDSIAAITVTDEDATIPSSNSDWYTFSIEEVGGSSNYYVSGNAVKIASGATLNVGSDSITIKATDSNGGGLSFTKQIVLTVEAVGGGGCGYPQWVNGTVYNNGDTVSNNDKVFVATEWNNGTEPVIGGSKWLIESFCTTPNCSDFPTWKNGTTYDKPGIILNYSSKVWSSKTWWSKNDYPTSSPSKWSDMGVCN